MLKNASIFFGGGASSGNVPGEPNHSREGQIVANRYRLDGLLDRGGQGMVYSARDLQDDDEVAIKILADPFANDSKGRERMFREARAMAVLSGTCAVRVLDQRWTEDGALCLVMERLHGRALDDFLCDRERAGQQFPLRLLTPLFAPLVDTLEVAHRHGIVHRDLKPANIFVIDEQYGGGVRLLDFGFAKFTRMPSFTGAGFVAGSPSYIAPEGWLGLVPDHRADVYALGAIMFRALAGRPPFYSADLKQILLQVTSGERPSLHACRNDLPSEVDDWVAQALRIDREQRFLSVRALWNALVGLLDLRGSPA